MRLYDIGQQDGPEVVHDRVLTIPNALSFVRLLALPILYLDLVQGRHLRALVLLGVFSSTDWFDGYIARRFDQVSSLGKLLDPLSDRLLLATVGVGMIVGDVLPLWAVALLIGRDVVLLAGAAVFMRRGLPTPRVTYVGKSATFGLMFALPTFLLASVLGDAGEPHALTRAIAWTMYAAAVPLYYWAGGQYAVEGWRAVSGGSATDASLGGDAAGDVH